MLIKGQELKRQQVSPAARVIRILTTLTQDKGWDSGCIWQANFAAEGCNNDKFTIIK
jgi:hypothetical protein